MLARIGIITVIILMLGGSIVSAANSNFEGQFQYWFADIDKATISGPSKYLNFNNDFGLYNKDIPAFRLVWHNTPTSAFRLEYTSADYAGTVVPGAVVRAGGTTHTQGRVSADMDSWRLDYLKTMSYNPETRIKTDYILELRHLGVDGTFVDSSKNYYGHKSVDITLPAFGLRAEKKMDDTSKAYIEFVGFPGGSKGNLFDGEFGVKNKLDKKGDINLDVGYRVLRFSAKQNDDYAKLALKGPFIQVSGKF